jgi:hypothetical protein
VESRSRTASARLRETGAVDVMMLREEQERLRREIAGVESRLRDVDATLAQWQEILDIAMRFAQSCGTAYRVANERSRVGTWTIDPTHSEIGFSVRHMMVSKVRGKFTSFSGDIVTGEPLLDSSVVATIDLSSIDTGMRLGRGNEDRQDWMKASRSALIVSAWVVGMPCGNPG